MTTTFDTTEALRLLDEASAALTAYGALTSRWGLSDYQLREQIENHDDGLIVTVDEAFVTLITGEAATPSPYGDGQFADACYEGYRDEVYDALTKAGLKWATCDTCGNDLTPQWACPEQSADCTDCCEHDHPEREEA